jgi:hypothetical protein
MTIQQIEKVDCDEFGVVTVSAIIEDSVLVHYQTHNDPAEYGPALCEASFELDEEEMLPDNEHDLIQYLEKLDLDWVLIDMDYY